MARYKKITIPRSLNPFKRIYEHSKTPFARLLRSSLSERFDDAFLLFFGSTSSSNGELSKRGYTGIFDYLTLFIPHMIASATSFSTKLYRRSEYFPILIVILFLTLTLPINFAFFLFRFAVATLVLLVGAPFIIATHHIAQKWDTSTEALEVKGIIEKGHEPVATFKEYLETAHLNINTVEIRKIKNKDEAIELRLGEKDEEWLPGQIETPTFRLKFLKNQFSKKSQCAFFNYNVGLVLNELEHQYPSEDLEKLLTIKIGGAS